MPARGFLDGRRLRRVALQPLAQRRLQLPGDRSGASAPHDTPVEARDGHDVVAGARQEQLGHAGQVRDRDGLLDDGEPLLVGQLQDDLARDAREDALRGGMGAERTTDHREQVGARPLREDRVPDEDGPERAGGAIPSASRPRPSRRRWRPGSNSRPFRARATSYTPSPNRKPRSSTDTVAWSWSRYSPFRYTSIAATAPMDRGVGRNQR